MLSDLEFERYIYTFPNLTKEGVEYVRQVRKSEPSRSIGVRATTNVCSFVYSHKMERTIGTESRANERVFLSLCEFDDDVLEIWDQPGPPVQFVITNKRKRKQTITYFPDYLILTKVGPKVVQVKGYEQLLDLTEQRPEDWKKEGEQFNYVCANRKFEELGIQHTVYFPRTKDRMRASNIDLLLHSRGAEYDASELLQRLQRYLSNYLFQSLENCRHYLEVDSYHIFFKWIDNGDIFFDIDESYLSIPSSCYITHIKSNLSYVSDFIQQPKIHSPDTLNARSMTCFPKLRDVERALERLNRINSGEKSRSVRRWKRLLKTNTGGDLSDLQILCMMNSNQGNHRRKVPEVVSQFLDNYILNVFSEKLGQNKYRGHKQYVLAAQEYHPNYQPVSPTTFNATVKKLENRGFARSRGGKRLANALAAPSAVNQRVIVNALPWQLCSIDHYKTDIYLIYQIADGIAFVERPWLTAMIDNATKEPLAYSLSFKPVSRIATARVIRDCARRHGKLPREIISDHGSDFKSVYFQALLAHYSITYTRRPPGNSRYGSEVERFFGEFKSEWLGSRPGNLADFREARTVDGKLAPKNFATLTPGDLFKELNLYLSLRGKKPRQDSITSRRDTFLAESKKFDFVPLEVNFDEEMMLCTAVDTRQYKVDFQRGIHIGDYFFTCNSLQKIKGRKSEVEVRKDPENPFLAFAFIDGQWEKCYASGINRFVALELEKQLETGFIVNECRSLIRHLKTSHDLDLAKTLNDVDLLGMKQEVSETEVFESDFPQVDVSELSKLEVGEW